MAEGGLRYRDALPGAAGGEVRCPRCKGKVVGGSRCRGCVVLEHHNWLWAASEGLRRNVCTCIQVVHAPECKSAGDAMKKGTDGGAAKTPLLFHTPLLTLPFLRSIPSPPLLRPAYSTQQQTLLSRRVVGKGNPRSPLEEAAGPGGELLT